MPTWLAQAPFGAIAVLFGIALARGQATYWLARLAVRGATGSGDDVARWRLRARAWLAGRRVAAARAALGRWGLPLITLCYFTVGLQTMVLSAAGVLRIGWPRFTLAQAPGALAWACIYATIGLAAWEAAIGAAASSPLGIALLLSLAALLVGTLIARRTGLRRRDAAEDADPRPQPEPGDAPAGA